MIMIRPKDKREFHNKNQKSQITFLLMIRPEHKRQFHNQNQKSQMTFYDIDTS